MLEVTMPEPSRERRWSLLRGCAPLALIVGLLAPGQAHHARAAGTADPAHAIRMPTQGCVTLSDKRGDSSPPWGNDPDLDITWATFASPPGKIRAFIHLDKLGKPFLIGHIYRVGFTINNKPMRIAGGEDSAPFASVPRVVTPLSGVTYGGSAVPGAVVDVVFDVDKSVVVLTVDRAPLQAAAGVPLDDGVAVPVLGVESGGDGYGDILTGDLAGQDGGLTYTLGDNHCFTPPAGHLAVTAPTRATYGHSFTVGAVLSDENGTLIARKRVSLAVGSVSVDATTDSKGAYSVMLPGSLPAGPYTISAVFAGDDDVQRVEAQAPLKVAPARPTLTLTSAASGKQVMVTCRLLSDLRRPLAGQAITWYIDGKASRRTTTDATGKTSFVSAPRHTIKASFAGATGRYLATTATRRV